MPSVTPRTTLSPSEFTGFDTCLEKIPHLFLLIFISLSVQLPSRLTIDDKGWEGRGLACLFPLLSLSSVERSSEEDKSFSPLAPFSSSLSSDPSISWFCLLGWTIRWLRCDLVTNASGVSLPRLFPSASDCRWTTFAIEAWIYQVNKAIKQHTRKKSKILKATLDNQRMPKTGNSWLVF